MIEVYDSAIPTWLCDGLIDLFDQSKHDTSHTMFHQVEIPNDARITEYITAVGDHYINKYDPGGYTPKDYVMEGFRIKRYTPNLHSFPWHVDVASKKTCSRYLAFLCYLNDSEAGTSFGDFTIEAKQGRIVVFPPMWMFPHEGVMPTIKPKYIMSTYYHYV